MSASLAPWTCPRCGKQATANLDALGPLGTILCTCGSRSRPAMADAPCPYDGAHEPGQPIPCWSPGGPCAVPNAPGCETCGPCNHCDA